MKIQDRLKAIARHIASHYKQISSIDKEYPHPILDLIIFHKIHLAMDFKSALQSFRKLKADFVDWNEVRISSIPEIQEALGQGGTSLKLAVFIKNLLDFLHRKNQTVDLEYLAGENISEIRRFLKQIKGLDPSTINMVLRRRKEYPVLPVDALMEPALQRLGIVRTRDNRDQKGKYLHGLVDDEKAMPMHHFLLSHSRETCPPDDELIQCSCCGIRTTCHYFAKSRTRRKVATRRKAPARKK